jgi:Zn-dependent M16 (insulinase) family peptidase
MAIPGNGHQFAMVAASAGASALGALTHTLSGLHGVQTLKQLDEQLNDDNDLEAFAARLKDLHRKMLMMPAQMLLVTDEHSLASCRNTLHKLPASTQTVAKAFELQPVNQRVQQFWQVNSQVQYCARAYPTVGSGHADSPALTVLGGFLRNGYLHRAIREKGGAYGGGASQDNNTGAFRFYSYRDPRFTETLTDFDQSISWLLNNTHEWQPVEEAILGVISSIDKPSSPAGEAKSTYHNNLHERTPEQQRAFRNAVLNVTLEDLQRVARAYLKPGNASTAVLGNQATVETARQTGLDVISL